MPTYLKPTINGNCGGNIFLFGGGEMWSARLHSPPVPSLGQRSMAREASTCAPSLSPFHVRTGALVTCSDMSRRAWHGVPYMIYRGREDEALQTFRILGIVHALYIKYSTHNTTLFYISIVHIEKICT